MKQNDVVEMEIFRTGDYGAKGAWSEADLETLAADYRPDLLEAPLTFDHAQTGPAYGWVSALRREGDRLVAAMKGVPAAVTELVRSGAYKRRSVELFRKLPHTGRPYLRAVSLLGAATPEVKGLRDVCFAAAQDATMVEFAEEEPEATVANDHDAAEKPAESCRSAEAIDARLTELFSDLRRDGYCLPEEDETALRTLVTFATAPPPQSGADDTAMFQEAGRLLDHGMSYLGRLLRQALLQPPMGEQARLAATPAPVAPVAQFSERTEPRSFALHQAALQLIQADPTLSYRDALMRVG